MFDVIKYEGDNNILVWKFPGEDFNTCSQLIVHESQEAIFVKDGKILDTFTSGRYTLHSQNIPLLRKFVNLPFNGISPFHCEVYFINKAVSMDILWGTDHPIPIQDAIYKIILPIRSNGQFAVKVSDGKQLMISLVGTIRIFDQVTLKRYFKGILLTNIKDYIASEFIKNNVSFLEVHSHLKEISNGIKNELGEEFTKYGIELINFNVIDIIPPEDDPSFVQLKKALSKKAEMSVMGYNYQQERQFDILDKAASNEGGAASLMQTGMGLGMGVHMGTAFGSAMNDIVTGTMISNANDSIECPNCGKLLQKDAKFCFECGSKIESKALNSTKCNKCGAIVPNGKFCLECGSILSQKCPNCGSEAVPGAKFCLECGNKLN